MRGLNQKRLLGSLVFVQKNQTKKARLGDHVPARIILYHPLAVGAYAKRLFTRAQFTLGVKVCSITHLAAKLMVWGFSLYRNEAMA